MIAILIGFACAAALDWLGCADQRAREPGALARGVLLAGAMGSVEWGPVWLAIRTENMAIAVASIAGGMVGTSMGFRSTRAGRVPNP